jgi:hypothetical protein
MDSSNNPILLGNAYVPVSKGAGLYEVDATFDVAARFDPSASIRISIKGINSGVTASYSEVQIVKGAKIGAYSKAKEDDANVNDLSTTVTLSSAYTRGGSSVICERNKNVLHLESYLNVQNLNYDDWNEVASNIPLQQLDSSFASPRYIPLSVIPAAGFDDTSFTGVAKIVNDKLLVRVTKGHNEARADAVILSADFNIKVPTFLI